MEKPNHHHILYDRTAWESNPESKYLREKIGMIALMDYYVHQELHQNVTCVPLLDHHSAQRVFGVMKRNRADHPLDVMDDFMLAVEYSIGSPKTTELDRVLGSLVVRSVYEQKEYIIDGMSQARVFDLGKQSA